MGIRFKAEVDAEDAPAAKSPKTEATNDADATKLDASKVEIPAGKVEAKEVAAM